jgi:hypothetical protein
MIEPVAHRINIPSDFYVEDGCCTSCDGPRQEAPDLFAYDANGHCYVCKQPETANEHLRMANAMTVQELGCTRYKGNTPSAVSMLIKRDLRECLDHG